MSVIGGTAQTRRRAVGRRDEVQSSEGLRLTVDFTSNYELDLNVANRTIWLVGRSAVVLADCVEGSGAGEVCVAGSFTRRTTSLRSAYESESRNSCTS